MKFTCTVTWLKEGRTNRQRPAQSFEVEELRVGSGGKADVRIGDRLVAGLALKLRAALGGLSIEPIDLFAGAFLNGLPIKGHETLEPGSALQIGQALLELTMPEPGKYALAVEENYLEHAVKKLSVDPTTKDSATLEHDGVPEAAWGRDPIHARLLWGAVVLGVALVGAAQLPSLQPYLTTGAGPLCLKHQRATIDGRALRCNACHVTRRTVADEKCLVCHVELAPDRAAHPPTPAAADMTARCGDCHKEHKDHEQLMGTPVNVELAALRQKPLLPATAPDACTKCHRDKLLPAKPLAETHDRARAARPDKLPFESFSHDVHLHPSALAANDPAAKVKITCKTCHHRVDDEGRDFKPVAYEDCITSGCHESKRVNVHGRGSDVCAKCHAARGTRDLKTVTIASAATRWSFEPQDHPVTRQACSECHVSGGVGDDRKVKGELFRHDRHLPVLANGSIDEEKARNHCAACHVNVKQSTSVADLFQSGRVSVDLAGCGQCHKGAAIPAVADAASAPARTRPDVVHREHVFDADKAATAQLVRGCFACHSLSSDGANMPARAEATNCSSCHGGHANLSCTRCHVDPDLPPLPGNGQRCERSVTDEKAGIDVVRGGVEHFRHGSPNHVLIECVACHAGVDQTTRLSAVKLPPPSLDLCVNCHALARFHR